MKNFTKRMVKYLMLFVACIIAWFAGQLFAMAFIFVLKKLHLMDFFISVVEYLSIF